MQPMEDQQLSNSKSYKVRVKHIKGQEQREKKSQGYQREANKNA